MPAANRYMLDADTVPMPNPLQQYSFLVPDGAENGLVIVSTAAGVAVAFWLSPVTGQVATKQGVPVAAGQSWTWGNPMQGGGQTTIYLAHNEAGGATARIQWEIPAALFA